MHESAMMNCWNQITWGFIIIDHSKVLTNNKIKDQAFNGNILYHAFFRYSLETKICLSYFSQQQKLELFSSHCCSSILLLALPFQFILMLISVFSITTGVHVASLSLVCPSLDVLLIFSPIFKLLVLSFGFICLQFPFQISIFSCHVEFMVELTLVCRWSLWWRFYHVLLTSR